MIELEEPEVTLHDRGPVSHARGSGGPPPRSPRAHASSAAQYAPRPSYLPDTGELPVVLALDQVDWANDPADLADLGGLAGLADEAGAQPGPVSHAHRDEPVRTPTHSRLPKYLPIWAEGLVLVAIAVVLVVVLRMFVVAAFTIPSASMEKTLHGCAGCNNDRVLVEKLSYRFGSVKRGDIVVVDGRGNWDPADSGSAERHGAQKVVGAVTDALGLTTSGNDYIKRVIGIPGDTVECCSAGGEVEVNNTAIKEPYVYMSSKAPQTTFGPVTVPAGKLFLMGDHRDASYDSRVVGPVPEKHVIGRAFFIAWPLGRFGGLGRPANFGDVPASTGSSIGALSMTGSVLLPWAARRARRSLESPRASLRSGAPPT